MHERIAKVTKAFLGKEDHGIWTAMLDVNYGGSGQGIGGYALDAYDEASGKRIGTAFGMQWIMSCCEALGVRSWGEIEGKTILVFTEDEGYSSKVIGIGPLPTERGRKFLFADLSAVA